MKKAFFVVIVWLFTTPLWLILEATGKNQSGIIPLFVVRR